MRAKRAKGGGLLALGRGRVSGPLKVWVLVVVGFGLVMVYSASSVLSLGNYGTSTVYFTGQLTRALIGFAAMIVVAALDYRIWERLAKPLLWLSVLALLLLAIPVATPYTPELNGSRRWIVLPGFHFQPLAAAGLALIVWMSATIVRKGDRLDRFSDGLAPLLVVPALMALLLLFQPDFKGASLLLAVAFTMLYLGGVRLRYLVGMVAAVVPVLAVVLVLEPYRLRRLASFVDPGHDLEGISYQIHQSLISLGSGGWLGVGLGQSKQKFAFLPAAYNDFIFSIIGEELGMVGTLFVLGAFLYFGWIGYGIARRAPDGFGFLLASGVTTQIVMSALVNLGVATAILPTTGLTLPFISYGGTDLIVRLVMVGILLSVSRDAVDHVHVGQGDGRRRRGGAQAVRPRPAWWRRLTGRRMRLGESR
ncbi:MAG: putative lipid II flippase FtsW [Gemmatimonadota bacterium]